MPNLIQPNAKHWVNKNATFRALKGQFKVKLGF
jgi:hypothetical protein